MKKIMRKLSKLTFILILMCISIESLAQEKNYYPIQTWRIASSPVTFGEDEQAVCDAYKQAFIVPQVNEYNAEHNPFNVQRFESERIEYPTGSAIRCIWEVPVDTYDQHTLEYVGTHPWTKSIPGSKRCQIEEEKGPIPNGDYYGALPNLESSSTDNDTSCYCWAPKIFDESIQWCVDPDVNPTPPGGLDGQPGEGGQPTGGIFGAGGEPATPSEPATPGEPTTTCHPCDIATGAKYRTETDFLNGSFVLTRNYHSFNRINVGFGVGWHNHFLKHIDVGRQYLSIYDGSGQADIWRSYSGVWRGNAASDYLLLESATGFTLTLKNGNVHEYDLSGKLLSETNTKGKITTYFYDTEGRLEQVSNHFQQSIVFEYSTDGKNHITKVIDSSGIEYGYEYDGNDNLTAVIYPDDNSDASDNPKRIYHYENVDFPNHMTGITDANGERYATFVYDENGKAIESGLAPTTNATGQHRVQLDYSE